MSNKFLLLLLLSSVLAFMSCKADEQSKIKKEAQKKELKAPKSSVKEVKTAPSPKDEIAVKKETVTTEPIKTEKTTTKPKPAPKPKATPKPEPIVKSTPKPAPKKPTIKPAGIKFEKETIEFGKVDEGERFKKNFYFKNVSSEPIAIKDATATCGCTVPAYPQFPLSPGEEASVSVTFNTTGKLGKQNAKITVVTTEPRIYTLSMVGEVIISLEEEEPVIEEEIKEDSTGIGKN